MHLFNKLVGAYGTDIMIDICENNCIKYIGTLNVKLFIYGLYTGGIQLKCPTIINQVPTVMFL